MPRELPTRTYAVLLCILIAANVSLYREILAPDTPSVSVLPVGEGSVVLVQAHRKTVLIDAGADASVLRILGDALPPWERTLDVLILTSTKKASLGGLPDLLRRYAISKQLSLTANYRLSLDATTHLDIVMSKDAPAGVFLSTVSTTTRIR